MARLHQPLAPRKGFFFIASRAAQRVLAHTTREVKIMPKQIFVHIDDVDHSATRPDTVVLDSLLACRRFLGCNPGFRTITHAAYTTLCASRLGVPRTASMHFPWGSIPPDVGVVYARQQSQCA